MLVQFIQECKGNIKMKITKLLAEFKKKLQRGKHQDHLVNSQLNNLNIFESTSIDVKINLLRTFDEL